MSDRRQSDTAMVETWLGRTGQCPLTLRIECQYSVHHDLDSTHPVIVAILPHSSRWQDVRFNITPAIFKTLDPIRNNLPCLQSMAVHTCGPVGEVELMDMFAFAPRLHTLETGYWLTRTVIEIPWAQLTQYDAMGDTVSKCLDRLQKCTSLVRSSLSPTGLDLNQFIGPVVALPHLRSLFTVAYIPLANLLDHLLLPALNTFCYISSHDFSDIAFPNASFTTLMSRSSCLLHTLTLSVTLTDLELIECLRCTLSLVILILASQGPLCMSTTAITQLTNRVVPCLVPKLRSLEFDYYPTLDIHALVDMIASRWETICASQVEPGLQVVRLLGVTVKSAHDSNVKEEINRINAEALGCLNQFRKDGLTLSIEGGSGEIIL